MRGSAAVLSVIAGLVAISPTANDRPVLMASAQTDPTVAAAGDIACDPNDPRYNHGGGTTRTCHMMATSDIVESRSPTAVLALGDNQYENGSLQSFRQSYEPTWGRFKAITHPAVGNHEYKGTPDASGYFTYFGAAAGDPAKGYYSFDIGTWHLIVLNSNCSVVGGCGSGSPQERWLRDDLAANAEKTCVLAYWHHPRFSSGWHGSDLTYDAFFRALYDARATLVLVAHDHDYERFAPQNPNGQLETARGIRQFVVGTGGKTHHSFATILSNSEVRNADTYGVLILMLHPTSYEWEFVPERGKTFTDKGSATCSPIL